MYIYMSNMCWVFSTSKQAIYLCLLLEDAFSSHHLVMMEGNHGLYAHIQGELIESSH